MKMNLKLCAVGSFASVPAGCPTIWHCGAVLVIRDTRLDAWCHHWWRPAHVSTSCQVWLNTPFTVYFVHMSMPLFTQTYCYTHTHTHTGLRPLVQDYLGEPVPERKNQSGFYWSKRQWVAVASAELRSDALSAAQPTASKHLLLIWHN